MLRTMYSLNIPMGVCHARERHLSVVSQFRIVGGAQKVHVMGRSRERGTWGGLMGRCSFSELE